MVGGTLVAGRLVTALLVSSTIGIGCSASITDDNTDAFCAAVMSAAPQFADGDLVVFDRYFEKVEALLRTASVPPAERRPLEERLRQVRDDLARFRSNEIGQWTDAPLIDELTRVCGAGLTAENFAE